MRITIVSGARPNFMKIAPICRAIDAAREAGKNISYRIVYTGPQDDTSLDASLFSDLSMRKPDAYLGVTGHNHSQVAASIMLAFERELDGHPAQVVLVVDDMTATMSCSIVAKKRGLKVAHVIAGTRSFDMNMPREVNRTIRGRHFRLSLRRQHGGQPQPQPGGHDTRIYPLRGQHTD